MPAVPMSSTQIADDIAERIRVGEYQPGAKLPSYSELGQLYNCATSTAARVILILRERGLVVGVPGRGTYVTDKR